MSKQKKNKKKDDPAAPRAAHIENPDTTSVPATPDQLPNGAPFPADMQESFVKVWRLLASLEKDGENLWQHVSDQTLSVFTVRLREANECIAESALFFTEEDYRALQEILRVAGFYLNGKVKLSDIRNGKIDSYILRDLDSPREITRFAANLIPKQIRQNKRWLTRYRNLLDKIRSSFHETILMTKNKPKVHIGDVNGDVIISQGQSGGTTAHDVITTKDKKPFKSKCSVITIISVVMLIIAILTYLGVKPGKENKMPKDKEEEISIGDVNGDVVISQDQSGGITAHTVNVNQQRAISPQAQTKKEKRGDSFILQLILNQTSGAWDSSTFFKLQVKTSGPYDTAKIIKGLPGLKFEVQTIIDKENGLFVYSTRTAPLKDEPIILEIQSTTEIDLVEWSAEPLAENKGN